MDPMTTSALISTGGKLLGGLFGKKGPSLTDQRRHMQAIEENRYSWMVEGAQRAGFNPSSVLGAVGGNFANQPTDYRNPFNAMDVIGDAIVNFADMYDPVRAETQRLNNELLQEELNRVRQTREAPGGVPGVQETRSPVENGTRGPWETGFGDQVTSDQVRDEAQAQLTTDQGLGHAYIDWPDFWPTPGYMEEAFGDDSFVSNWHKKLTPWMVTADHVAPQITNSLQTWVSDTWGNWDGAVDRWLLDDTAPPENFAPKASTGGRNRPKTRGKTRRFN